MRPKRLQWVVHQQWWVTISGLIGFDFEHRGRGSVSVQARDHRKRRSNQLSADSNQRDYALAA